MACITKKRYSNTINVTMDTYGHLMKVVNQESAKRLDTTIFKQSGDFLETSAEEEKAKVAASA